MKKWIKIEFIHTLEKVCGVVDWFPWYEEGRWYRHGQRGCLIGICHWAVELDEKWGTGVWEPNDVTLKDEPTGDRNDG